MALLLHTSPNGLPLPRAGEGMNGTVITHVAERAPSPAGGRGDEWHCYYTRRRTGSLSRGRERVGVRGSLLHPAKH